MFFTHVCDWTCKFNWFTNNLGYQEYLKNTKKGIIKFIQGTEGDAQN